MLTTAWLKYIHASQPNQLLKSKSIKNSQGVLKKTWGGGLGRVSTQFNCILGPLQ